MTLWAKFGKWLGGAADAAPAAQPASNASFPAETWLLELNGHTLARLSNRRVPDQFWHEFDVTILTESADTRAEMLDEAFWERHWANADLSFLNETTGRVRNIVDGLPLFALNTARNLAEHDTLALRCF